MHRRTARSEEGPSTCTPRRAAAAEAEAELNSPHYVRTAAGGAAGAAAGGGGGGSTARRRQIQTQSRWVARALCASVLLPLVVWGALLRRLLWTDGTPPTKGNLGRPLAPGTRTAGAITLGTPRLRVRGLGHDDEEGEEATDETAVAAADIHNECDRGREQQEANHAVPEDDGVTGTTDRSRRRRKVFVFPPNLTDANEHRHIFLDGIARSARLDLSLDLCDRNADWVVDINRCTEDQLKTALRQRPRAPEGSSTSSKRGKASAVLVDWSDGGWLESELEALLLLASDYFGRGNVHYVTRQFMDHRNMKRTINGKEFGNYGVKWSWDEEGKEFGLGGRIKAARYPVRSDLVRSISEVSGINMDGSSASTSAITQRPRSRDVASFWSPDDVIDPLQWDELTTELRASVSKLVASLGGGGNPSQCDSSCRWRTGRCGT